MEGAFCLGVVAAETSGDKLGGGVVRALRRRYPNLTVRGIGGPELALEGLESLCDIHDLSVMGLEDIVRKLPRALLLRRRLFQDFLKDPPDVFLGIDSPDFNLTLESWLRVAGIPVAHLVSPTVWAWRGYRVRKIRRAVDRMLVLFPFEEAFYRERGVPATFVGHPAADEVTDLNRANARRCLTVPLGKRVVSILPGSRVSEIKRLAPVFTQTIKRLVLADPDLDFLLPFASPKIRETFFE
ncbi:lipid-A-disaccharide synthase, partial [Gammaproteobacteria bacterium]|nr:lipid-A-disaccharide synthase [Gammaproteobacteria bacterium]